MKKIFISAFATVLVADAYADNPPITPAWAFRHVVWEDSLNTTNGAVGIVDGYLEHDIPVGSVIIDSPWSTSYNDFNWDLERYPNPEKMIGYFKEKNVKVLLWLAGAVNHKCKDTALDKGDTYDEAVAKNYGINQSRPGTWWKGEGIHIDFTNPEAKEWWYSQLDKVFIDGVYGWKVDQGEYWFGDTVETSIGKMSNAEFRPYYYDAMYDYTVKNNPAGLIIARPYSHQGGFTASIGKLNMGWCGDFSGDWKGLKQQIDNIYNSAVRGYGSIACEVGGFYQERSTKTQLIRYAQFGCMTATMINGGENGAFSNHLPWYHDGETEDIYRKCVILHEELVPYLFSSSVDVSRHGGSLLKDVNLEEESHRLGASLFTKAITNDGGHVEYRLPADGEWIDYWSGEKFRGGTLIKRNYSIDQFPLFVKCGSVIPIEVAKNSFWCADKPEYSGARTFIIYPADKMSGRLHLPKGEGIDYDDYTMAFDSKAGKLTIRCPKSEIVNVVVKGLQNVKEVSNVKSWSINPSNGDLALAAEGSDIDIDILVD